MAAAEYIDAFVLHLGQGGHDFSNDTLKLALTGASGEPTTATDTDYTDLTDEVANGTTGYTATGQALTTVTWTEAAGVATLDADNVQWLSAGAGMSAVQYAVLYNDTMTSPVADGLIAYWDYGSEITNLAAGETFTFNILTSILTIAKP